MTTDIKHTERRRGLSIIHFTDGSTTITSSLVEASRVPADRPAPKIMHGNCKAVKLAYRDVHEALRASVDRG